jgi:hypothetical protein
MKLNYILINVFATEVASLFYLRVCHFTRYSCKTTEGRNDNSGLKLKQRDHNNVTLWMIRVLCDYDLCIVYPVGWYDHDLGTLYPIGWYNHEWFRYFVSNRMI